MSAGWGYGALLKTFIWGYLLGGLTLLPALAVVAWFWGTKLVDDTRDVNGEGISDERKQSVNTADNDDASLGVGLDEATLEKLKRSTHEPDTFAGYFAVCREYVPGGINGKPPDRLSPAGVVSPESPSIYQSMYRNLFDRNRTAVPTIEPANARNKRARNVFYVVLRLGHLMLYDNDDQLEVRHVISLAHYQVDVYAGGDHIPEGELWIKRNCIRLVQELKTDASVESKCFFLFSDNCSEKEDFYHTMLQAQEHHRDENETKGAPVPLKFDTPDLVKLVQQLHASEENLHTRWINALIGRVFLALYQTSEVKEHITTKITKKIARVPKPALIRSVAIRSIDMGTLPPFLTNPKLKELNVDGDLVVEADVSYKGNFRIEIAAIARIDLGTRFKAREVTLVLATILKRLEGHILIRIKPPPSNRLWVTFEHPPRMELSLEPIVSSRQITYGVILRAMESRIREVVNETLVLPNWDDVPFTNTVSQAIRGGIWRRDEEEMEAVPVDATLEKATIDAEKLDEKADSASSHMSITSSIGSDDTGTGISSSTDYKSSTVRPRPMRSTSSAAQVQVDSANASAEIVRDHGSLTPSSIRSLPVSSPLRSPLRPEKAKSTAALLERTSAEDLSSSLPEEESEVDPTLYSSSPHHRNKSKELSAEEIAAAAAAAAAAASGANTPKKTMFNQSLNSATNAARNWLTAKQAAPQPRKGHQRNPSTSGRPGSKDGDSHHNDSSAEPSELHISKHHTEPMGRGHPLPPPGQPLPPPTRTEKRQNWAIPSAANAASTFANIAKRKAVGSPTTHSHGNTPQSATFSHTSSSNDNSLLSHSPPKHHTFPDHLRDPVPPPPAVARKHSDPAEARQVPRRKSSAASSSSIVAPPPLPKRRQRQPSLQLDQGHHRASLISQGGDGHVGEGGDDLLVVKAPVAEHSGNETVGNQETLDDFLYEHKDGSGSVSGSGSRNRSEEKLRGSHEDKAA